MLGVMFDNMHSYHDMGLLLSAYPQITPPTPKTKMVEVPGMDGALDLSKVLTGCMQYNRRAMQMEFAIMAPRVMWPEVHSDIMDALHGREMSIILDDDPEYCYTGTLAVAGFDPQEVVSSVKVTADIEPYKTRLEATCKSYTVSGSLTATITGRKKPVVPVITASSAMQLTFGGKVYNLASGENTLDDVIIREGVNSFVFTGDGSVSLAYREGRF